MIRITYLASLFCLGILPPVGLERQTREPSSQIDPAIRSQTQDSGLPPGTRAQIDKLASRAAEQLHKYETNPGGRDPMVIDFPDASSAKSTGLGFLLRSEFPD